MDALHRKIDLQSSSDLTYLLNNIKAAAQEKLDLAIPPSAAPEGEDAYRSKVEELVQEVRRHQCLPSLSANRYQNSTYFRPSPSPCQTSLSTASTPLRRSFVLTQRQRPIPRMTMATTNPTILDSPRSYALSTRSSKSNLHVLRSSGEKRPVQQRGGT